MKIYCHLCGAKYKEGKTQPWECSGCGNLSFANPNPATDIVLFDDKQRVLLSKRGIEPAKGKYDFPGGFLEIDETLEEGLRREIQEELGLSRDDFSEPIYVSSLTAKYRFSKEEHPVLGVTFAAKLLTDKPIRPEDDVESIMFVDLADLDNIDYSIPGLPTIVRKAHGLLFNS